MDRQEQVDRLEALRMQLLGEFRVWVGEREIQPDQWRLRKAQNLLKLLALVPRHHLHREELMERLWPESDPELAANNLHRALFVARRALDPSNSQIRSFLKFEGEQLCLCPETPLWVDVEAFEAAASQARSSRDPSVYSMALDLYTGELLPEDRYEDWAGERREALRQEHLRLLLELARLHETRREYGAAIEASKRLLSSDPAHEEGHASLMRLYALSGQRQQALRQYQALQESLHRELDAEPEPQITHLHQEILSGSFPPPSSTVGTRPVPISEQPALREPERPRHNLPIQLTSFVGRELELAALRRLLHPSPFGSEARQRDSPGDQPRLLTLTGVGGCGKTRIALESAFDTVDAYPAGVWLVELDGLSDPELVPREVASVLDLRELPGKPLLESLIAYLKPRHLLLLLDNCEHLVGACARLVEALLRTCPALRILATSREALRLPGERLFPLSPLSVPQAEQPLALEELPGYDAVQLFIERAQAVFPAFQLSPRNAPAVVQICVHLDGIPLAIELAAARASLLPVEQIAARLDDRFRLLTSGSRIAPDRQQTLQAALDWSYRLLSTSEQALFRRLSVFAGGFDLQAAEALAANGVDGLEPSLTLDLLSHLADKSLLVVERTEGGRRYRLLETLRTYARERLESSGEAETIRQRHAQYYLALAEKAEPKLRSGRQLEWLERLEREHDNLRAALAWGISRGEAETGQRLAGALWYFWSLRGYFSEGLRWLEDTLALDGGTNTARLSVIAGIAFLSIESLRRIDQMVTLCQQGFQLAQGQGDKFFEAVFLIDLAWIKQFHKIGDLRITDLYAKGLAAARETKDPWLIAYGQVYLRRDLRDLIESEQGSALEEDGLFLARQTGDRWLIALSLFNIGYLAAESGDFPRALACIEEDLTLWQALGDRVGMARAFIGLGYLAFRQGDYVSAYQYLEKRLAKGVELDHKPVIVHSLNALGVVAHVMGDEGKAQALFEQSLGLSREFDYPWGGAVQLNSLGFLALRQGQAEKAHRYFLESLKLYQGMNDPYLLAGNLYALGKISALHGQPERAARWLGAVGPAFDYDASYMNPGFNIWIDPDEYSGDIAAVKAQLGEVVFAQAWEAGCTLGLEGAIQEALEIQGIKPQS